MGEPDGNAIMSKAKLRLEQLHQQQYNYYNCFGTSVDVYQFHPDPNNNWKNGAIFSAINEHDLTFNVGMVAASSKGNTRDAMFLTHEPDQEDHVENMMMRSFTLKDKGIQRPYVVGYNTQLSQVVSGWPPNQTFEDWLDAKRMKGPPTSLPNEVKQLIRTALEAAVEIWLARCTSDHLAAASSYLMIGDTIKINPLFIRDRGAGENDFMLLRAAFGTMIMTYIHNVWGDEELLDLVELLNMPHARVVDIVGAPVLNLADYRELMYHTLEKEKNQLRVDQKNWLSTNANPLDGWQDRAKNADPALRSIIDGQIFETDYAGALHFAKIVSAHYLQHFRKTAEGQSGVSIQDRVDKVLKEVLPRLLSKRYNGRYLAA